MKYHLICFLVLLNLSFPILSAQFSKEEIQEGKAEPSTPNPTPNIDSLIPNKSPLPNTWGVSEKDMEEAFEKNEHLVCLMVFGKNFKRLNNKWKEVLGWETEELINTPYYSFIHPDDMEKTLDYEAHFIPTGFVNRYRSKDGSYRWFSWIGLSNLNKELESVSSFAIVLDITLDEILKKESKTQIKILNEHTSLQTRVIKSIVEIQQLYLGELGRYDENKSPSFSFQYILRHFLNLSGSDFAFMGQVLSEKGEKELCLETWESSPSLSGEGKRFFDYLKSSEKVPIFFKDFLDMALDQGKQVVINDVQAYLRDKGYSKHFPYFKSFLGVLLISTNGPVGILALVNREHGYNDLLLEWFEPLFLLSGRIVNEVKLLHFQEEAKKQAIEMEKAEAKSEAKSAFLAHMSHELRTPLSGLIGILDLLNEEHIISPEGLNYLQMAKDTSSSLLDILNDILDLSKIEVNKLSLEEIEFNPLLVTKNVVKLLSFSAKKKNLSLKFTADPDIPDNLIGDPNRVRQILMNIVGNAIKFTEKGSVKVSLEGKPDEDKKFNYILSATVKDTGIGISHDNLQNLFQPFFQAEESMSRRFGGTGLGLYITKCLCELMGGSINVKSIEGKGSKFHFEINLLFPKKVPVSKSISCPDTADILPPLNVLVVEDNPVIQLVTKTMLERSGCSVRIANNGIQSLEALKDKAYDLVLMDGEMPEMNGLEAAKIIRQSYGFYDLPIIGLTAHAMLADKQKFLEAGMNGYLTKPVNKKELNAEILRCLQERREHPSDRASGSNL